MADKIDVDTLMQDYEDAVKEAEYQKQTVTELTQKLAVFEADNAMLQRAVEEANATIASLTRDLNEAREAVVAMSKAGATAPVPQGLIGVMTAKVDNLPSLDQLPAHPTMVPPAAPGEPESQDQRDVREHLERKRAAAFDLDGPFASGGDEDEGTKPQE